MARKKLDFQLKVTIFLLIHAGPAQGRCVIFYHGVVIILPQGLVLRGLEGFASYLN